MRFCRLRPLSRGGSSRPDLCRRHGRGFLDGGPRLLGGLARIMTAQASIADRDFELPRGAQTSP